MFKLVFFHKFGTFSSPLFHQYFFYCFQLPHFWYYHIHVGILNALVFLWGSVYFYYFFLFFRLYNFYCFILKSANSSFWQLKSIVESLKWIFFFTNCYSTALSVIPYLGYEIVDMESWHKLDVGFPLHVGGSWHS